MSIYSQFEELKSAGAFPALPELSGELMVRTTVVLAGNPDWSRDVELELDLSREQRCFLNGAIQALKFPGNHKICGVQATIEARFKNPRALADFLHAQGHVGVRQKAVYVIEQWLNDVDMNELKEAHERIVVANALHEMHLKSRSDSLSSEGHKIWGNDR